MIVYLFIFNPCPIQNRFECPYNNNKEEEEAKSIDVDQLFQLSEIAFLVELVFATAEEDTAKIQIKNRQDVYNALTDRETLDAIMQQGVGEENQKYKDEIVEFFMSIKDKVRMDGVPAVPRDTLQEDPHLRKVYLSGYRQRCC